MEIPYNVELRKDTGLYNSKLGIWLFLASEIMLFGGLFSAYILLRTGAPVWPPIGEHGSILNMLKETVPHATFNTVLLILSSVTMVMAYANIVEKNRPRATLYLALTVIGGALFLCGQMQEYWGTFHFLFSGEHAHGLIANGLIFGKSHYATTFYVITGFHGCHVLTGVIYLTIMLGRTMAGKYDDGDFNQIEIAGLFWHFVDLVWILVFTLIYLIPN